MHTNAKKNVTLDDLAVMVAKGFSDMDEKMDEKFNKLEIEIHGLRSSVNNYL